MDGQQRVMSVDMFVVLRKCAQKIQIICFQLDAATETTTKLVDKLS